MYPTAWLLIINVYEGDFIQYLSNVPIKPLTSFKQSGFLRHFYILDSKLDIQDFFDHHNRWFIIGKGSNSLILDSACEVPFMTLGSSFQSMSYDKDFLYAKAGVSVPKLMAFSQQHGLSGLEFMAGVPASLGGMIAMNFGCWGVSMADIIHSVDIYIPKKGFHTFTNQQCQFGYRTSIFHDINSIILGAKLRILISDAIAIKKTINHYVMDRVSKQPMRIPTFGSIFKNPDSQSAASLIEKVGLKGYHYRSAKVSNYHANFMENIEDSSSQDALTLIDLIQQKVNQTCHILLEPEVSIFK